jgi:DNA-binding PadR family transcriptional regulator
MARKDKPLPAASLHIVLALLDGEQHGYALMRRVEELSDGAVRMGPGTLYGTLNRLVADGLIVETTDRTERADNERRRYYELTPNGRAVAVGELERLQALLAHTARHLPRVQPRS